jgi:hypothetical protein
MLSLLAQARFFGYRVDPLYGSLTAAIILTIGFALWLKADKPLLGVPLILVAGYLGWTIINSIV